MRDCSLVALIDGCAYVGWDRSKGNIIGNSWNESNPILPCCPKMVPVFKP